jgi:hypothetical protein
VNGVSRTPSSLCFAVDRIRLAHRSSASST